MHAIELMPRPRIRRAARTQTADPVVRSERRYNPHLVVSDLSSIGGVCVALYSRDLFRVHSVWIVPGTLDASDE